MCFAALILEHISFAVAKISSKNFSLKKMSWYFVMVFDLL
jgi:hypothetical protein